MGSGWWIVGRGRSAYLIYATPPPKVQIHLRPRGLPHLDAGYGVPSVEIVVQQCNGVKYLFTCCTEFDGQQSSMVSKEFVPTSRA